MAIWVVNMYQVLEGSGYSAFSTTWYIFHQWRLNKHPIYLYSESYSHFLIRKMALTDHLQKDTIHLSMMTCIHTSHFLWHKDFLIAIQLHYHSSIWDPIHFVSSLRTDRNQENILHVFLKVYLKASTKHVQKSDWSMPCTSHDITQHEFDESPESTMDKASSATICLISA